MPTSYVSARFENSLITGWTLPFRSIFRNLDALERPTYPDTLRECAVVEYVNDTIGERFVRVATLSDIGALTVRTLNSFEATSADFTAGGVVAGDVLQLTPSNAYVWQSEEFPSAPYNFTIDSVPTATRLVLTQPLPSVIGGMAWSIPARGISGIGGYPRRDGFPAPGMYRDSRMATFYDSSASLDAFVASCKAQLDALASASTATTILSENYTSV